MSDLDLDYSGLESATSGTGSSESLESITFGNSAEGYVSSSTETGSNSERSESSSSETETSSSEMGTSSENSSTSSEETSTEAELSEYVSEIEDYVESLIIEQQADEILSYIAQLNTDDVAIVELFLDDLNSGYLATVAGLVDA